MPADISSYRKSPRPKYYNANTRMFVEISLDFETFLLRMSGINKRNMLARLQKSVTVSTLNGARDNLMRKALDNMATNAGSVLTELDANLSEYQTFFQNEMNAGNGITEVGMLVSDIGRSYGESLARREQANNDLTASAFLKSSMSNPNTKKQIQSWIEIVTQYIIPD